MPLPLARLGMFATLFIAVTSPARALDAGLPPPVVPQGFGVNIHFTEPAPGEMARFAEGGFRLVRMDFGWQGVERTRGVYDFHAYDRLVDHLTKVGARPVFILDYGHPFYDKGLAPHTPEANAAFARFAAAAATHFRGKGVLWEIWNEPNLDQFWKPGPDAEAYAQLALATARAIRQSDPKAVILAPGSSTFPWDFFEPMFRLGLLEEVDAVSVHPYRQTAPETAADDFGRLRALIARHASPSRRDLPIVSSEWGYSTAVGERSEAEQARYLTRMWLANLASGVNLSIFYDWRDDGDNPREHEFRFGTVRRDLTPKPSFEAARAVSAALDGYTFRHRLRGASDDDWRLLFQTGDSEALVVVTWNTRAGASSAESTPQFRRVRPGDEDFLATRRLASVRYTAGPLAEGTGLVPAFDITVVNPGNRPARVAVTAGREGTEIVFTPAPGTSVTSRLALSERVERDAHRSVPISVTWDGTPLPDVAPRSVWRTDPVTLSVAPRGDEVAATVENPAGTPFSGRLLVESRGREVASADLRFAGGVRARQTLMRRPPASYRVRLVRTDGATLAATAPRHDEPMAGFGEGSGTVPAFNRILHVDNKPETRVPVGIKPTGTDGPLGRALVFHYQFDRGWRYATLESARPLEVPHAARAWTVWAKSTGPEDYLRSRFRDTTGQTFQVDLGRLGWTGWKPLRVALDGTAPGSHWGGAGDGVPHTPLAWEGLILVDSARRQASHEGELLLASPSYEIDETAAPVASDR